MSVFSKVPVDSSAGLKCAFHSLFCVEVWVCFKNQTIVSLNKVFFSYLFLFGNTIHNSLAIPRNPTRINEPELPLTMTGHVFFFYKKKKEEKRKKNLYNANTER